MEQLKVDEVKTVHEPEAPLANRGKRLGGAVVDVVVLFLVLTPVALITGVWQQLFSGDSASFGQHLLRFIVSWGVFFLLNGYWLSKNGQTIGKVVFKTKIVDLSGKLPGFGKLVVLRYLALGLVFQMPFLGPLVGIADPLFIFGKDHRCLHDHLAGTRVIDA